MSSKELAQLRAQSERLHLPVAEYVRRRIFGYRLPAPRGVVDDRTYALLSKLVIPLRNASGNLNQLAHQANLGFGVNVTEVRAAIQEQMEAIDQLRQILIRAQADFEESLGETQTDWEEADQ